MDSEFLHLWIDPILHGPPQPAGHWAACSLCPCHTFLLFIFSLCGVTCSCLYPMQTDAEYMAGMTIQPYRQMQCCKMNVYSLKGQAPLSHNIFTESRLCARYSSRCWDIGLGQQFLQNLWSGRTIRKKNPYILTSNCGTWLSHKALGSTANNSSQRKIPSHRIM